METPRWWDYLRRSNVTPKEVINLPPVSSYDQAICACLFYCVVIWEKTALPVFFLRVVQYRCVLHMREMLMTLFLSLNLRVGVPMFSCIYLSINTQIVSLTVTYYLFILTTHKSLYTYVIFLHNLFYNIVLWYTLLYNKLFISLMWFVCIINCYYVIILRRGKPK